MIRIFDVILFLFCFGFICSCSSELDFENVNDIAVTPQVDADLVFFTLGTEAFINTSIPDTTLVVRDTTRLEFLDDDFIRDNIQEIKFTFQVDNSFAQSFSNQSIFLNENGVAQYMLEFAIAPSLDGFPARTSIVVQLDENELQAILNSIQVVDEVRLNTNEQFIDGELSLQSKAVYSLEFKDF